MCCSHSCGAQENCSLCPCEQGPYKPKYKENRKCPKNLGKGIPNILRPVASATPATHMQPKTLDPKPKTLDPKPPYPKDSLLLRQGLGSCGEGLDRRAARDDIWPGDASAQLPHHSIVDADPMRLSADTSPAYPKRYKPLFGIFGSLSITLSEPFEEPGGRCADGAQHAEACYLGQEGQSPHEGHEGLGFRV